MKSSVKYLTDSKTIIEFFNGRTELFHLFDKAEEIAVSVISVGEIYSYAKAKGVLGKETAFSVSKDFCSQLEQIPVTENLCEKFSELKEQSQKLGLAVDDSALWVASTAAIYKFVLISNDPVFEQFKDVEVKKYL